MVIVYSYYVASAKILGGNIKTDDHVIHINGVQIALLFAFIDTCTARLFLASEFIHMLATLKSSH